MPTLEASSARAIAGLIVSVDGERAATDSYKLPPGLLATVQERLTKLGASDPETAASEGARASSSAKARRAYDHLETLLRHGYASLEALPDAEVVAGGIGGADRLSVLKTYGWNAGKMGRFSDARVRALAELALAGEEKVTNPAWRYQPAVIQAIRAQLAILDTEEPRSQSGDRQTKVEIREEDVDAMNKAISRVRHFYCSASDDTSETKELARIGLQPRRRPGEARRPEENAADAPPVRGGGSPTGVAVNNG